jgi:hypothetical protein
MPRGDGEDVLDALRTIGAHPAPVNGERVAESREAMQPA